MPMKPAEADQFVRDQLGPCFSVVRLGGYWLIGRNDMNERRWEPVNIDGHNPDAWPRRKSLAAAIGDVHAWLLEGLEGAANA